MSSAASRRRQRQRRAASARVYAAQHELAARQLDLAAYERVIVDMTTGCQLPPFSGAQALALVTSCRDAAQSDCARLTKVVAELETARKRLDAQKEMSLS